MRPSSNAKDKVKRMQRARGSQATPTIIKLTKTFRRHLPVLLILIAFIVATIVIDHALGPPNPTKADPSNSEQTARGQSIYARHCASCHGVNLEGQPNWRTRLPTGRLPAPPHDATGHTWHHPDELLFGITKYGPVPGRFAPSGYQSDMPAFENVLSDEEIWAVLAYIKSTWAPEIRNRQKAAGKG